MSTQRTPTPTRDGDPLIAEADGLRYALDRPPSKGGKKVVVTVALAAGADTPPLVDRTDLYSHRSRLALAMLVSETFGREPGTIMGHLALLLDQVERSLESNACQQESVVLTPARRARAEKLLAASNVLDLAANAMASLGHVGEEPLRRLSILIAISRFLARPLSGLLLGAPAIGKSTLLAAVQALAPPEQVVASSRITSGSLWHMGEDALRHRLVIVDEFDGQVEALHAVRVLQSQGWLTLTTTMRGRAENLTVRGPVAVMSGSVSTSIDLQNTSRCIELFLDDSPEQTRRVQEAQARAWAGIGPKPVDVEVWHDAQRLLAEDLPVNVVVPFAPKIVFPAATTTDRRSSAKILGLVAASAAIHARQRERDREGRIVASLADYTVIYDLVRAVIGATVDGLTARATALYRTLVEGDLGKRPFTRRQAAAALGAPYMTTVRALAELVEHELVRLVPRSEKPLRYQILDRSVLGTTATLAAPHALGE